MTLVTDIRKNTDNNKPDAIMAVSHSHQPKMANALVKELSLTIMCGVKPDLGLWLILDDH